MAAWCAIQLAFSNEVMMTTFSIALAEGHYFWFLILVAVVMVSVVAPLALALRGSRTSQFVISPDVLELHGDVHGRTLPISQLRLESVRRVDRLSEGQL